MSRIKGKDTKPEMIVRRFLHKNGFRFRLHVKDLPGKPDIVLPKYKTVIFVHGCFWHGHEGCKYFKIPALLESPNRINRQEKSGGGKTTIIVTSLVILGIYVRLFHDDTSLSVLLMPGDIKLKGLTQIFIAILTRGVMPGLYIGL